MSGRAVRVELGSNMTEGVVREDSQQVLNGNPDEALRERVSIHVDEVNASKAESCRCGWSEVMIAAGW
jgi:hypothetical protein